MKQTRGIALALSMILLACSHASGQVLTGGCPSRTISEITFERGKPFGPEETSPDATFGWFFRLMNAVHVTTRESTVRRELFFVPGDCVAPALIAESERSLRRLRFLSEVGIDQTVLLDGSARVSVRTVDAWARSASMSVSVDDGFSITGVSARDSNFLGTGTALGFFRRTFRERKRTGVLVRQTNLLGTRIDATVHAGNTRAGRYYTQSFYRPFAGESGRTAFRQVAHSRDDYFAYSLDPALPNGPALIRFEAEHYELGVQRRFGSPSGLRLVVGGGWSREVVRFNGSASDRVVEEGSFSSPDAAPPEVTGVIGSQARDHAADRLSVTLGLRRMRIEEVATLDAVRAPQDVEVGASLAAMIAPSLRLGRARGRDVLARLQGTIATTVGTSYLSLQGDLQAREVLEGVSGEPTGTRDLLWDLRLHSYWHVADAASVFARVLYTAGYSMDRPFQLTMGGREGVRAFSEDAFPGSRRMVATLEPRLALPGLGFGLADVGLAGFMDVGKMWGGGVPYGATTEWLVGVGAGLRFGLPAGGQNVLRVDLGRPMTRQERHEVVFRVYLELFGLLDRRSWPSQTARSRWYGADPDLTIRPVDPLAGN